MVAARPSLRDLGFILLALALMGAALWPLRGTMSPWLELPLMGALGAAIYVAVMWAGDVARCRALREGLQSLRAPVSRQPDEG